MWGILTAILSGLLMSVQGIFNTEVTKQTSLWVSTGWVQATALLVCIGAWMMHGREPVCLLWQTEPKYLLLGGVIGAFITVTVIQSMNSLGPAQATMIIVIAQMTVSYLVELGGWFGVETQPFLWRKLLGAVIAAGGVVLFQWK